MTEEVQVRFFPLLWCELCQSTMEPPKISPLGLIASNDPLKCDGCGELITLLACAIHPSTDMWHEKLGASWKHVVYLHALSYLKDSFHCWVKNWPRY